MLIIIIIQLSNNKLFNKHHTKVINTQLIGSQQVILSLTIANKVKIERVGTDWRATPAIVSGQALTQMMQTWQTATGIIPVASAPVLSRLSAGQFRVVVSLANQVQPLNFVFTHTADSVLIYNSSNQQTLAFPLEIYRQLIPFELN